MAELPTWNGQTVTQDNIMAVTRAAFDIVVEDMAGASTLARTKVELMHLLEAGSYLYWMGSYATSVALTLARDAGASWAELGAAMGITRSSATSDRSVTQRTNTGAAWRD
jgi:hypothetical protein